MKAFLMYPDRDFDLEGELPWNEAELVQDLELGTLYATMAKGDQFLAKVAKQATLSSLSTDVGTILYRQAILRDCLDNPAVVRNLYDIVVGTVGPQAKSKWNWFGNYPSATLNRSVDLLETLLERLKLLRSVADEHAPKFKSPGLTTLFAMLRRELSDNYLAAVKNHLVTLKFRNGVLLSAHLGEGNKGVDYVLRTPLPDTRNWLQKLFPKRVEGYVYKLPPRDESGAKAMSDLNDRGINLVANAASHSADHITSFFDMMRAELAFYVGCLNLREALDQKHGQWTFPEPLEQTVRSHRFDGLYDVCLQLRLSGQAVGNAFDGENRTLVVITGANQGGKSTFLRGIGLSQVMMQCGMFVAASALSANISDGIFTHYKREEDTSMASGKLDEELRRMADIVEHVKRDSIVLFNESFAATNEREGSEIARQIVETLCEAGVTIVFVTHMFELAHGLFVDSNDRMSFLRAERRDDGSRSYKLVSGEPLRTSYGEDLYSKIFEHKDTQPEAA